MSQAARTWGEASAIVGPRPRWMPRAIAIPWLLGGIALLAVTVFDLGPALPFADDWGMAWSARQFIINHQLHIFPVQSALALVQTFTTALLTFGHTDQRLLRLTVMPFILLVAFSSYRIARELGATQFWSGIAAVTLLGTPLYLHNATTYMSDAPYVGLLMAAAAAGVRWVKRGEGQLACTVFAALCPLQRQLGIMLPLAITVGLLIAAQRRAMRRTDWLWLAALWLAVGAAALVPILTGIAPPTQANRLSSLLHLSLAHQVLPLAYFPAMLGLILLPFGVAAYVAARPSLREAKRATGAERIVGTLLWLLLVAGLADLVIGLLHFGWGFYPGNIWMAQGFTPTTLGNKASPFSLPLFLLIEALSAATFITLLRVRRDLWHLRSLDAPQVFLIAVSASQFLPLLLLQTAFFDRYYIPVVAPLIPLVALRAGSVTKPRLAAGWAIGSLLLGLGLYIVGEQDFEAWHVARHAAAALAFAQVPATGVDAGYEENAMAVEVPSYEANGVILGGLMRNALDLDYAATGPAHPVIRLEFARLDDPRPGVDYHALTASGRIVLVRP
jgi:4-amino-4-deoxy-L-arabinose transferase-like glycosyltransferase